MKPRVKAMDALKAAVAAGCITGMPAADAEENFIGAVTSGKASLELRPRYEYVDQDGLDEEANALTLRTQLGYATAPYKGFTAQLELESVNTLGDDDFNNTKNGKPHYPIVLDPEDAEINLASLSYNGFEKSVVTFGRQLVSFDNQRFVGPVGWRQNETSLDALRIEATPLGALTLNYVYVDNVNRLFGEDHPGDCAAGPACSDFDMSSHLLNAAYTGLPIGKLVGYGYFLEFDDLSLRSQQTLGVQLTGKQAAGGLPLVYHLEYASQSDYADGAASIDADYLHLALGAKAGPVLIKLGQETLGGDGSYGFSTPLATVHAFNGWADKFLATPVNGLVDTYLDLGAKAFGMKFKAVYHDFESDEGNIDYGSEIDLLAVKKLTPNLAVAAKYASYDADEFATDTDKFWLQADFKF